MNVSSDIDILFRSFSEAWNRSDIEAMVGLCMEDASLIDPTGGKAYGRSAIRRHLAGIMSGIMRGTTSSHRVDHVHLLTPLVALVDATHVITGMKARDGCEMAPVEEHVVASLVKHAGHWLFVDIRPYGFQSPPASK